MNENQKLKYFLYARKSSESEDRQMCSIDDQLIEIKRIAEELGLNIVGEYCESKSAKAPGRVQFDQMLNQLEKGKADAIICWKLNRLARNPVDGGRISWMLQNGIIKHIQCFGRDYRPSDNVLMMQVELGMANQFVKDLSVDVKRGMRQKAERGWYPTPLLPLGYLHNKDSKGRVCPEEIKIDEIRFPIVKRLWKLLLTGAYSISELKREGDKMGLANDMGKPYVIHTYHNLFQSEFYYGFFSWKDKNGHSQRIKGMHKAMISKTDFDKAQRIIDKYRNPTRPRSYNFTFKGLMHCGECGRSITAERKFQFRCTGCNYKFSGLHRRSCPKCEMSIDAMNNPLVVDKIYYRCTKFNTNCSQRFVTEEDLNEQYLQMVKQIQIPESFHDWVLQRLENFNSATTDKDPKLAGLKKSFTQLENRIKGLTILRAECSIENEEFQTLRAEAQNKLEQIKKQLDLGQNSLSELSSLVNDQLGIIKNSMELFSKGTDEQKRELLLKIASNQRLKDKKVQFIRPKPLSIMVSFYQKIKDQIGTFEPEKSLMDKGDYVVFDACDAILCRLLQELRKPDKLQYLHCWRK